MNFWKKGMKDNAIDRLALVVAQFVKLAHHHE
jgi:hypothetical protein